MANAAFSKPLTPQGPLADVIGSDPRPRTAATADIWTYIKSKGLQDPKDKRRIVADAKLKALFDGADSVTMFELTKYVSKHLAA